MGPFMQGDVAGTCATRTSRGNFVSRFGIALMLAVMLLGAMSGFATQGAAGEAGTINIEGVGLMASFQDETIIEWMYSGERVDILWGPENGKYEIRYYGVDGWVWAEYLTPDGVGGGNVSYSEAPAEAVVEEHWIDVNRSQGTVTLFVGDVAQATYGASMGYEDTSYGFYATAIGTYYVNWKNAELQYTPYADNYITNWIGFDSERANGFHSYTKDANGDIIPNGGGNTAGCVALAPGDIDALFNFAYPGMRVEVHW